ncbi:putative ester cyclase [Nocardia transvalensis]|uniref:Putative ester cyclase n=1 Tax=Nocardia transvalensis TaxID=37333 RepID=A0A7W9PAW0_9NOCA|nr:ester cyclase [Nocardia transvalensis]MBB5912565.1 putative ester cyclase [Nocardia transvalensis]
MSVEDTTRTTGERLYQVLDAQDWSTIGALVSPDLVVRVGSGPPMGLAAWRRNQEVFYRGFPDGRHILDEVLVIGARFVSRCRFEGTHIGSFGAHAPTGTAVSVGVIHIDHFDNGLLVEHYGQLDLHGLLQQIGSPL